MATTVVSGRIEAEEAEAVTRFIEESGMTWNGVINSLSRYIYEHRSYPWDEPDDRVRERRRDAFLHMSELIETFPRGTFIDTMTDDDLRKLLAERDDV